MAPEINTDRTRLSFSLAQMCMIIGALVAATWIVAAQLYGIRSDISEIKKEGRFNWSVGDMERWVYTANSAPKFPLPWPAKKTETEETP